MAEFRPEKTVLKKIVTRIDDADRRETLYNERVLSGLSNAPTNNSV